VRSCLRKLDSLAPREAAALQRKLAARVVRADRLGPVHVVAGVDVHYTDGTAQAAAALYRLPGLEPVGQALARKRVSFPYIPGLLSFREVPAALAALAALPAAPDLILCDGQGIAHPRRCGLASHVGLLARTPSIGVAKTRLVGEHRAPPGMHRGAWAPLVDRGERVGAVLRTRARVKPVYVSIGHRVSLATALRYVMACTTRYRIPEPLRRAHQLAGGGA
jgi:deoxyribonuclease V